MAIPESQLKTWANQGAIATAKSTHEAIRAALEEVKWPEGVKFDAYLQGSYRNGTNIRGDSDVDVVVQLNSAFHYDISQLSQDEQQLFSKSYGTKAGYWLPEFRRDVVGVLENKFGYFAVEAGSKSIRVPKGPGRLKCDVIPCVQFRKYTRHRSKSDERYVEGMAFLPKGLVFLSNDWIVNYPRLHYENGTAKNSEEKTRGLYKSIVRIVKNARTYLVERDELASETAPSYFLESFLYNVPDKNFRETLQGSTESVLNWLAKTNVDDLKCQNEQVDLFGDHSTQWSVDKAQRTLKAIKKLWDNWY